GQIADTSLGGDGPRRDVIAADDRGAGGRSQKARDHLHRRRLSGAVRAEKSEHLTARHRKGDVVDRLEGAEMFDEMTYLQHTRMIPDRPLPIDAIVGPDCGNTASRWRQICAFSRRSSATPAPERRSDKGSRVRMTRGFAIRDRLRPHR